MSAQNVQSLTDEMEGLQLSEPLAKPTNSAECANDSKAAMIQQSGDCDNDWEVEFLQKSPYSPDQFLSAEEVRDFFENLESTHGAQDDSFMEQTDQTPTSQNCNNDWDTESGCGSFDETSQSN